MTSNRERLSAMLEVQRGLCFWCCGLIALNPCKGDDRAFVRQTARELDVLCFGVVLTYGVATVDHVVPQWRLGDSRERNLVAACAACNQDRGTLHAPGADDPTGLDAWMLSRRRSLRPFRMREQSCSTRLGDILMNAIDGFPAL